MDLFCKLYPLKIEFLNIYDALLFLPKTAENMNVFYFFFIGFDMQKVSILELYQDHGCYRVVARSKFQGGEAQGSE